MIMMRLALREFRLKSKVSWIFAWHNLCFWKRSSSLANRCLFWLFCSLYFR